MKPSRGTPPPKGTPARLCLALTAGTLAAALLVLHWPVLAHGLLVTPAGMHHAQWPWKAFAAERVAAGAVLEDNSTLSDLLFEIYPWQWHIQRSLAGGAIPLWNPYSYCGVPFVANAQSAVFYPLHWPAWVFPSMRVFTIAVLLKVLLAGTFMAVFLAGRGLGPAACVVGSVSFALGGFMTSWLGYAHTNAAIALPLLMHAAGMLARSPGADGLLLFAVAGAAQYLGGHPETSLHIVGASVLYFLWLVRGSPRRGASAGLLVAGGLLGLAIASVQLLPFVEYLMSSAQLRERQALPILDPTLPAEAPMTLLLPGLYGWPWARTYSGPAAFQAVAGYAGAGVLLLAGLCLRWIRGARFFLLLATACAVTVYGPPAIRSAIRAIPVVGLGSHNRLLLVLGFCLAALAAIAVDRLGDPAGRRARLLGWLGLLTILSLALIAYHRERDPLGARLAGAVVAGTAVMAGLATLRPARRAIYTAGIAVITAGDMTIFAYGYNPHADPGHLFPATPLTDFLRQDASSDMTRGGRMMTVGWTMRPETHMIYRLSSIEGFDAMDPVLYRQLLDRAQVAAIHLTGHVPDEPRRLLDLMGLRHVVTPPGAVVSGDGFTLAYDGPDGRVFVNQRALPRFSFVTKAVAAQPEGPGGALDLLATGRADPGREVALEAEDVTAGADSFEVGEGPEPAITLERNTPADLMVRLRGHARPGYLVVADAYDRGWRAEVNGRPEPVLRANHTFRAVRVPAGEAEVRLAYRPFSFVAGAWISVVSLLCLLGVALMRWGAVHTQETTT